MNASLSRPLASAQHGAKRIPMGLVVAIAVAFLHQNARAIATFVDLGTASSFAILAGTPKISNVGGSKVTGDVGLAPATGTGIELSAGQVMGTIYAVDADGPGGSGGMNPSLLNTAKSDLGAAYDAAAGQSASTVGTELGGSTKTPGVYVSTAGTFEITGILHLDAQGDSEAVFIFQMATTLTTEAGSTVILENGAQACHVFWQVGSSATLKRDSDFVGSIMALTSISLGNGAEVDGRLLARNGAVSLDNNTITRSVCNSALGVPDTGSTLFLLGTGLGTLWGFRRRFFP